MALVQFLLNQPLWAADAQTPVTVGDVTVAAVVILLGALSWRYMNTLFAVTIFPRMPDDPGVRFAVVTLCRYAVLGLTSLIALGGHSPRPGQDQRGPGGPRRRARVRACRRSSPTSFAASSCFWNGRSASATW